MEHPFVFEVTKTLVDRFGTPDLGNQQDPFEELLFIILSSKTPPDRYQKVYNHLKGRYSDLTSLASASWVEVAELIAEAGLQNRKAKALVKIAQQTMIDFGSVTLSPLASMTTEEAENYLLKLPEVSLKTAKCVLMYSLNREVFPVDTHCLRISHRLGWLPFSEKTVFTKKIANYLENGVPGSLRMPLHVGMIELGRKFCTPRNPVCKECPILKYCPTGQNLLSSNLD